MIHPRPFSFLLLSKRRTRLTKDKCGYAEVRRFRTNDEWNFIRMNFSFSPSIAERPHTAKEQSNQENQFIENTQRVRERFARNFPSAPPSGKHSNTSPAFPKFDIFFPFYTSNLEINCTRYRQSKY